MSDLEKAFLQDIIENPDDDTPRLVYADWLEIEAGQGERARFIRVQCELARYAEEPECTRDPQDFMCHDPKCPAQRCYDLRERERILLGSHALEWSDSVMRSGLAPAVTNFDHKWYGYGDARWTFRRGFVAEIRCHLAAWLRHGKALRLAHPVESVEITDAAPGQDAHSRCFGWFRWDNGGERVAGDIPTPLWQRLDGFLRRPISGGRWRVYLTPKDAIAALNDAALEWASPDK